MTSSFQAQSNVDTLLTLILDHSAFRHRLQTAMDTGVGGSSSSSGGFTSSSSSS